MNLSSFSNSDNNSNSDNKLTAQNRDQLLQTTRQLLAEVQALSSRITAVNEIATAINRSLDLNEILRIVGKQAKWLLDFQHLSVYLCSNNSAQLITLFGPQVEVEAAIAATGAIGYALRSGQAQLFHQDSEAFLSTYASAVVIPLESERQMMGTINFATTQANAYTLEDVRIGYLLGLQLAAAIRNAERFDGMNQLFEEMNRLYAELDQEKRKSEKLLLNILPSTVADELKTSGSVKPVHYDCASVLFTDFKDFTKISESVSPEALFEELNYCFSHFDRIIEKFGLEKLKTIGDSYMCVGGVPISNSTHAVDTVLAALEIQKFMRLRKAYKTQNNQPYWDTRIGIHSGPLLAGVVGEKKFAYDVWGDTVNTASGIESAGIPGEVNISKTTLDLIGDVFEVSCRGSIAVKNKGNILIYTVTNINEDIDIKKRLLTGKKIFPHCNFVIPYSLVSSEMTTVCSPVRSLANALEPNLR